MCNYSQKIDTAQPAPGPGHDWLFMHWPEMICSSHHTKSYKPAALSQGISRAAAPNSLLPFALPSDCFSGVNVSVQQ